MLQDGRSLDETRTNEVEQLLRKQLDRQQELLHQIDQQQPAATSNAQLVLQQLIKRILYAPILTDKCPKQMKEYILFCTSYIDAGISSKMPYTLTLDKKISDAYHKHNEFVISALLMMRGRARNVTVELNTIKKAIPIPRMMSRGQSHYTSYPKVVKSRLLGQNKANNKGKAARLLVSAITVFILCSLPINKFAFVVVCFVFDHFNSSSSSSSSY